MTYAIRSFNGARDYTGVKRAETEDKARRAAREASARKGQRSWIFVVERYDHEEDEWRKVETYQDGGLYRPKRPPCSSTSRR